VDLEEWDGEVWTGLIWLRVGTKGGLLSTRNEPSSSIKYGEFIDLR
jgi:hypothetical protein